MTQEVFDRLGECEVLKYADLLGSRIKSLEQELVRANTMISSGSSPRSVFEMSDMKSALRSKDDEIRHVNEIARESMYEVEERNKGQTAQFQAGN